ncbi:MAG: hypothetical protein IJR07_06500 [Bacteroidaceae bacterium]|nr:hypothetical protein [Bacteroidaceae bacterium]
MEEQKNNKRVLSIKLDNDVKKLSITGTNSDEKVVMRQELNKDDLEQATGGAKAINGQCPPRHFYNVMILFLHNFTIT